MKVLRVIFTFIFEIILAVAIIGMIVINLLSNTILNKDYIFDKLIEIDYYSQMYQYVESNFENYIQQSGLDESIMDNLVTEEQIQEDTKIILESIFDGNKADTNSDEIKRKLMENIQNSVREIPQDQQKAVDSFVDTIADEYSDDILDYEAIDKINEQYSKVQKYIAFGKKAAMIAIVVSIVLLLLINIKEMYYFVKALGVSSFASGIFLIGANRFINAKVNISSILLLNDAFSELLRNILTQILNEIQQKGIICAVIGLVAIILPIFIHNRE